MALYRQIFIEFWKDPKVTEEMSPEDRYVLLYLLTNPYTTQIGIYQITKRQMAFDLGYSTEAVGAILTRFEKNLGLIRYNDETREIAIKNWGKYNLKRGGKPIMDCIKGELSKVKDKKLIEYVAISIPNNTIKDEFLRYANVTLDVTSTISGQEEEQEEEQEQEVEQQQLKKDGSVVVDKIKSYFDLDGETIKKVANVHLATGKDISYLIEKLELVKSKPDIRDIVGYLISALKNDYKNSINQPKCFIPSVVNTRFHSNCNQTFIKYTPEELEQMLFKSQEGKFN